MVHSLSSVLWKMHKVQREAVLWDTWQCFFLECVSSVLAQETGHIYFQQNARAWNYQFSSSSQKSRNQSRLHPVPHCQIQPFASKWVSDPLYFSLPAPCHHLGPSIGFSHSSYCQQLCNWSFQVGPVLVDSSPCHLLRSHCILAALLCPKPIQPSHLRSSEKPSRLFIVCTLWFCFLASNTIVVNNYWFNVRCSDSELFSDREPDAVIFVTLS